MTRPAIPVVVLAAAALAGCAEKPLFVGSPVSAPTIAPAASRGSAAPNAVYAAARRLSGVLAEDRLGGAPTGIRSPAPEAALLPVAMPEPRETGRPLARVEAANRSAAREPTRHGYINAAQVYDWAEGALYRLYTAPERVSEIALQAGEQLIAVAAGDTVRWIIGDTTSGSGAERRTHVLIKPVSAGLRTNLVITTDRRVYHVALESSAGPAMASMAWAYPDDALLALERGGDVTPPLAAGGAVGVESLNFAYAIEGDDPSWRPLRAFDDGSQVFIEFPEQLATDEAPPLFVAGEGGKPELVNYRVRGRFYVVDRLFARAELRLGEKRQKVVRIRALRSLPRGAGR